MPAITIRHHVTNKTDSQNAGALISKKTSTNARLADTTCSATEMPPGQGGRTAACLAQAPRVASRFWWKSGQARTPTGGYYAAAVTAWSTTSSLSRDGC